MKNNIPKNNQQHFYTTKSRVVALFLLFIASVIPTFINNPAFAGVRGMTAEIYLAQNNDMVSQKTNSLTVQNGEVFIVLDNGEKLALAPKNN